MKKEMKLYCLQNGVNARDVERFANVCKYTNYYYSEEEEKEIEEMLKESEYLFDI